MRVLNILLIDDNEGDIMLLQEACEMGKLMKKITVIKDGKDACDYVGIAIQQNQLPDIVLLDINLPRRNGHQVLKYLKAKQETKNVPVIMFTTSSSEKDKTECFENGAEFFISKPLVASEFCHTVELLENFWLEIVKEQK